MNNPLIMPMRAPGGETIGQALCRRAGADPREFRPGNEKIIMSAVLVNYHDVDFNHLRSMLQTVDLARPIIDETGIAIVYFAFLDALENIRLAKYERYENGAFGIQEHDIFDSAIQEADGCLFLVPTP